MPAVPSSPPARPPAEVALAEAGTPGPSAYGEEPAPAEAAPDLTPEQIEQILLAKAERALFGPPTASPSPWSSPPTAPSSRGAAEEGDGGFEITIGRLEVVAPPPPPEPAPVRRPTPRTSLQDYLEQRRIAL